MALFTPPSSIQTKYTAASHLLNVLPMFVIPAIFPGQGRTNQSKTTQVAQFYHKTIVIDHYNIIIYYPLNFFYFHTCPCLISGECFSWPVAATWCV